VFTGISSSATVTFYNTTAEANLSAGGIAIKNYFSNVVYNSGPNPACFNKGTLILYLVNSDDGKLVEKYVPIEKLSVGSVVKTYLHGYKKIECIGKGSFMNNPCKWQQCMYYIKKTDENGLIDDFIVTGQHAILVDTITDDEKQSLNKINFNRMIGNKHLLLAGKTNKFTQVLDHETYTYYHFSCENDGDINKQYGV
jgi:hypothetical protein